MKIACSTAIYAFDHLEHLSQPKLNIKLQTRKRPSEPEKLRKSSQGRDEEKRASRRKAKENRRNRSQN